MHNYKAINYEVMLDTKHQYESVPELIMAQLKNYSFEIVEFGLATSADLQTSLYVI